MSKLFKNFVGIDISKEYYDVMVIKKQSPERHDHSRYAQNQAGYKKMVLWLKQLAVHLDEETLFCMEDTGIYNHGLVNFLSTHDAQLWVEMPLRIKKADGFQRGGDDKDASLKIAIYAFRYQDRAQLWQAIDSKLITIKNLIALRDRVVKSINQLEVPVNELIACGCTQEAKEMKELQKISIKALKTTKKAIENKIKALVNEDEKIRVKVRQVESIVGIGHVTAVALFIYTKGFTSFENARQLACYCGVVPFKKESGSSVRTRAKVSVYANKKLKWLLHMCAMSAIRYDQELKLYYNRKKEEGKNRMSVINAVRNKLVHRVFAITRDNRVFQADYVRKCA